MQKYFNLLSIFTEPYNTGMAHDRFAGKLAKKPLDRTCKNRNLWKRFIRLASLSQESRFPIAQWVRMRGFAKYELGQNFM